MGDFLSGRRNNALFKYGAVFSDAFEKQLQQHVNIMYRQCLADRRTAKIKGKDIIEQLRKVWNPTPNHFNWAHEIAVDLIAFWTCGPAYLATFNDVFYDAQVNPYQIGQCVDLIPSIASAEEHPVPKEQRFIEVRRVPCFLQLGVNQLEQLKEAPLQASGRDRLRLCRVDMDFFGAERQPPRVLSDYPVPDAPATSVLP